MRGDFAKLADPRSMAPYRKGLLYFHGGASLQEAVVPVITVKLRHAKQPQMAAAKVILAYKNGAKRVTTRLPVVDLAVEGENMFSLGETFEILLEAEARNKNGEIVGEANRRQTIRVGAGVAFAQIGIVGFDGQIELEALRLFDLPEAAPAMLNGTPLLMGALFGSGRREFAAEVPWDLPSLAPGATVLIDVAVNGARAGDLATASLVSSTRFIELDAAVWSNNAVHVEQLGQLGPCLLALDGCQSPLRIEAGAVRPAGSLGRGLSWSAATSPLSGRKSTYRAVRIARASSGAALWTPTPACEGIAQIDCLPRRSLSRGRTPTASRFRWLRSIRA